MYRQHEDPYVLQDRLEEAKANLLKAQDENLDIEIIISLHEDVEMLKERINFAWQDADY